VMLYARQHPFPPTLSVRPPRATGGLLRLGFTVSQVVHDYGDICQTITALAVEQSASISVEEFQTLNLCLDTAIAEAVTEYARVTAESRSWPRPVDRRWPAAPRVGRDEPGAQRLQEHAIGRARGAARAPKKGGCSSRPKTSAAGFHRARATTEVPLAEKPVPKAVV